jgi:hypothetical protein
LRISLKNIEYLKQSINNIDEKSRENLSNVTKEIGNKIIFIYDNLANAINDQRCENLRLQSEIASLTKEKNSLKHEIKNLVHSLKKLELFMGVEEDPNFENMITQHSLY